VAEREKRADMAKGPGYGFSALSHARMERTLDQCFSRGADEVI